MSGAEVLGVLGTSIDLVSRTYGLLKNLRECWKNPKDVTAKLEELSKRTEKIENVVSNIKMEVERCLQNKLGSFSRDMIDALQEVVDQNVNGAMTALKTLDKYQESLAGPSSAGRRFRHQLRTSRIGMTFNMMFSTSILESLTEAESCLGNALQEASSIDAHRLNIENLRINNEIQRKLDEAIRPPRTKVESFVRHFDRPDVPDNLVVDFCSTQTQEGQLMSKLLEMRKKETSDGISAVGRGSAMHGMGGVGKTTTLRAICYQE